MAYVDEQIIEAAQAFRLELQVPSGRKTFGAALEDLVRKLDGLLARAARGEVVADDILELVYGVPAARAWFLAFLGSETERYGEKGAPEPPEKGLVHDLILSDGEGRTSSIGVGAKGTEEVVIRDGHWSGAGPEGDELAEANGGSEPEAEPARPQSRWLNARVFDLSNPGKRRQLLTAFRAKAVHKVDVWIGPEEAALVAKDHRTR